MFYVQLRPPPPIKMDGRGRSVACFHGIFTPYYRLSSPIHCISEEPAERIGVGGMSTSAAGTHLSAVLDSAQQGRLDSEPRAPRRDRWMGPEQRSGVQVGAWAASAGVAVVFLHGRLRSVLGARASRCSRASSCGGGDGGRGAGVATVAGSVALQSSAARLPRRLIFCFPMRTLVMQTHENVNPCALRSDSTTNSMSTSCSEAHLKQVGRNDPIATPCGRKPSIPCCRRRSCAPTP